MEVVYALAAWGGCTPENLERWRRDKHEQRGGFTQHIILEEA